MYLFIFLAILLQPIHAQASSTLQQLVFEAVYARDGGNYQQYRQMCSSEYQKSENQRLDLIKKNEGRLQPTDLEVRAYFGELNGPNGTPERVRCLLKFFVTRPELSIQVSDSPTRGPASECESFLEENIRNKNIFWQQMRSGWSFLQGDWCYVRAVEVLGI